MVTLCPVRYVPGDSRTDLVQIARDPQYDDALIIFNDNFSDRNRNIPGANTAALRPLVFDVPCRVVGVSTGWSAGDGGFQFLKEAETQIIIAAFERVNTVLHANPKLHRIVYSCNLHDPRQLGFAIFKPAPEVVRFINDRLAGIPKRFSIGLPVSFLALDMAEEIVASKRELRSPNLDKRRYQSFGDRVSGRHRHSIAKKKVNTTPLSKTAVTSPFFTSDAFNTNKSDRRCGFARSSGY